MRDSFRFPEGFLWGAATSAYQIEGCPDADGAGHSIWHRFSNSFGRTINGETGAVACDHYNRWADDVALMKRIGLNSYRFSISWSRIFPTGTGATNAKGVAFYDKLIDKLLENGIAPNATLFHWDLPAALDDRGGWLNPDIADWFADYARVMFDAYGDRVPMWATLNEPWVVTDGGYLHGALAPGHRNLFEAPLASINLMRSHGAAAIGVPIPSHPLDSFTTVYPWRVSPHGRLAGPAPLRLIALAIRRPGPVELVTVRPAEALVRLTELTLGTEGVERAMFLRLDQLVRSIEVVTVSYEDSFAAVDALAERVCA